MGLIEAPSMRWDLLFVSILAAIAIPLMRLVFCRIVAWHLSFRGIKVLHSEKIVSNLWYAFYYTSQFVVAAALCLRTGVVPFETHLRYWFPWPNAEEDFSKHPMLGLVYAWELGFYSYLIVALIFWDVRKKDFKQMLIHHVATVALLAFSFLTGHIRVGINVMLLHDPSDILLFVTKSFHDVSKYASLSKRWSSLLETVATSFFVVFAASWFVTRLILYPIYVLGPALCHSRIVGDICFPSDYLEYTAVAGPIRSLDGAHKAWAFLIDAGREATLIELSRFGLCFRSYCFSPHTLLTIFLILLQVLHVMWFWQIVMVIARALSGNKLDDVRSDDEDDEKKSD